MTVKDKPVVGDLVTVKGHDYGYFKLHEMLPKGAHGRTCQMCKVLHTSSYDRDVDKMFSFAYVKTFRYIDLRKVVSTAST